MKVLVIIAVLLVAISGCKFARMQIASQAKVEMTGMTSEEVLSCMGIPAAKASEGATEVWTYPSGGDSVTFGTGTAYAGAQTAYGTLLSQTQRRYCIVNVVMKDGRVERVNYSGRTGGLITKGEQCAFAVENCVRN